ncbi:MAG TPA: DUF2442 domain-containing protein [Pirellulales bacterium]|jgi:hypothetical protein|nr:DUF2442 domain-containing protein [Pirellulales bacterium]
MLIDIVDARPLDEYRVHLRFEDGVEGTIDLAKLVRFESVFAPLHEKAFFNQVHVNSELGTIEWPNGADLDPDVLYAEITGIPISAERRKSSGY